MRRLRYIGPDPEWHGPAGRWIPGAEKSVEDDQAERLFRLYPGLFEDAEAPAAPAAKHTKPAGGIEKKK